MLLREDARGKTLFGVSRQDRNRLLQQDRSRIGSLIDQVDGTAREGLPRLERAPLSVKPGKLGEERGMDVQDPPAMSIHEFGRQQAHVTRETNQVRPGRVENSFDFTLVLASRRENAPVERVSRQTACMRAGKTRSGGNVGDDGNDLGVRDPPVSDRVRDGFEVRTAAGKENGEAPLGQAVSFQLSAFSRALVAES